MVDEIDGLSALSEALAIRRSGYHRHENAETGAVAIFPSVKVFPVGSAEQMALETEWAQRAIVMHQNQVPVTLEAKPVENTLAVRLARGN